MAASGTPPPPDSPLRPFVITGGRTTTTTPLGVDTLLRPAPIGAPLRADAAPQLRGLLRLCRGGVLSVAEAAAYLQVPVSVVLVLADDLIALGHLQAHTAQPAVSVALLQEVLDGLRNL